MKSATAFGRRDLLVGGAMAFGGAALLAACGQSPAGELGRVGVGADNPDLPSGTVDDAAWLRTAASIEQSIVTAYQRMIDEKLVSTDQAAMLTLFQEHHSSAADALNEQAIAAGGDAWACGNPRLDSAFITPVFDRVTKGAAATDVAKAIEPSDDPRRDMLNLVHTLESLSAETAQALVSQVTTSDARVAASAVGVRSSRQAALASLTINPGGYVPSAAPATAPDTTVAGGAPAQTPIPLPVAIPSTFGLLSAITYIGGHGDENGVRLRLNFETPSLNSIVYSIDTCS